MAVWQIISELVSNGVQIYQFPTDDETVADLNASMNVSTPHISISFWLDVQFEFF